MFLNKFELPAQLARTVGVPKIGRNVLQYPKFFSEAMIEVTGSCDGGHPGSML